MTVESSCSQGLKNTSAFCKHNNKVDSKPDHESQLFCRRRNGNTCQRCIVHECLGISLFRQVTLESASFVSTSLPLSLSWAKSLESF
jgi:hypothetical protein